MNDALKAKLAVLPLEPGCYLMKNAAGDVIYVGKAKKLKNRVNQYFVGAHDYKVTKMVSQIEDFEILITRSEKEALVLEINLIKRFRPRFNIMFMDDKSYPYLRLNKSGYPKLSVARLAGNRKKDRHSVYFGPYPDATAARVMMETLNKLFPLRKCKVMPKKVCLYYHLGQCLGPCEHRIEPSVYESWTSDIRRVLKGDGGEMIKKQEALMAKASEELRFEEAAKHHQVIESLRHIIDKQQIEAGSKSDLDIFQYYQANGYLAFQILMVRSGTLLERYSSLNPLYSEPQEVFVSLILQYYENHPLPDEILLPRDTEIADFPQEIFDLVHFPQRGRKYQLLQMAKHNAKKHLEEKFLVVERLEESQQSANQQLSDIIGKEVHTIEVYDNSHTAGVLPVSGMVFYQDGKPDKTQYRHYQLHQGNNDVESMKEVLYRRYFRILKEGRMPADLILVDGGWNQIAAAKEILDLLDFSTPVYGLVKDDRHRTADLMNGQGERVAVDPESPLFFFLVRMQDEVHRFAISYHKNLRQKAQTRSILDEIEGVGPTRKKQLLHHFGSLKQIKNASVEALSEVVPEAVAKEIAKTLANLKEIQD
jgi:excinuclease ABC subunit C